MSRDVIGRGIVEGGSTWLRRPARASACTASVCVAENRPASLDSQESLPISRTSMLGTSNEAGHSMLQEWAARQL